MLKKNRSHYRFALLIAWPLQNQAGHKNPPANPISNRVNNVKISGFIELFSEIPNRSLTTVCIGVQ
jgi:hypothetical protein